MDQLQYHEFKLRYFTFSIVPGSSVRLVFAAGIWLEAAPQSGTLKVTFSVPSSLLTGDYQGLWGNMNGDPSDDFGFASDNLDNIPAEGITQDAVFHWGQTCK